MAPKVTSSSNRNKRSSKKPVTKGQNPQRAKRQTASRATVSQSGGSRGSGARVTNASQRTTSGSARVTGGARPALPPGRQGGALATRPPTQSTRQATARAQLRDARKGSTGPNRVGQPAGSANRMFGANVVNQAVSRAVTGSRLATVSKLAGRASLPVALAAKIADVASGFKKLANHPFLKNNKPSTKPQRQGPAVPPRLANTPAPAKPPKPTPKPKPPSTATPTRSSAPARPAAASRPASRPAAKPAKAKPHAASKPAVAQTSGIGPVKSGDEYARKKGSLREQARKLREMQAESRKRQGK